MAWGYCHYHHCINVHDHGKRAAVDDDDDDDRVIEWSEGNQEYDFGVEFQIFTTTANERELFEST